MNGASAHLPRKLVDDFSGRGEAEFRWEEQETAEHPPSPPRATVCQSASLSVS